MLISSGPLITIQAAVSDGGAGTAVAVGGAAVDPVVGRAALASGGRVLSVGVGVGVSGVGAGASTGPQAHTARTSKPAAKYGKYRFIITIL
jgi:hypothetical protein